MSPPKSNPAAGERCLGRLRHAPLLARAVIPWSLESSRLPPIRVRLLCPGRVSLCLRGLFVLRQKPRHRPDQQLRTLLRQVVLSHPAVRTGGLPRPPHQPQARAPITRVRLDVQHRLRLEGELLLRQDDRLERWPCGFRGRAMFHGLRTWIAAGGVPSVFGIGLLVSADVLHWRCLAHLLSQLPFQLDGREWGIGRPAPCAHVSLWSRGGHGGR
mmetsp:Transcript_5737/g.14699  ORF Transcript_5737/g.14699 Transcript_5737/m.14699 type:complete len:214 (+) Transcript_5737:151-792(+)